MTSTPWSERSRRSASVISASVIRVSTLEMAATPFPLPGTPGWSLAAVDGVAGNDLWSVGAGSDGDMSLSPYILHWDGESWQLAADVPQPGDQIEFNALLPLASDDIYVGGSWFTGGVGYGPVIEHFDGSSWTVATQDGGGGPMIAFGDGHVLALGNPSLFWNGAEWKSQPGLQDFDAYGWSTLEATGPCNAVGAAVVDIASVRRSVAVELRPIVFNSGFD